MQDGLARFIFERGNKIRGDGTVTHRCFMPDPDLELSVTRHNGLTDEQIWALGRLVGEEGGRPLRARTDVQAPAFIARNLMITPAPTANNPNHANVVGWPEDIHAQKAIAQQIALVASPALYPMGEPI